MISHWVVVTVAPVLVVTINNKSLPCLLDWRSEDFHSALHVQVHVDVVEQWSAGGLSMIASPCQQGC
jgi:hypothetical protein